MPESGRIVGIVVDGVTLPADLVIDASGRSSRFTDAIRPTAEGDDCGSATSLGSTNCGRCRDGPMNSPIGLSLGLPGYWAIAFLHDNGAFSITFTHDGADKRLRRLRTTKSLTKPCARFRGYRSGSIRRASPITPGCPVDGCTTPTAGNSTPRVGRRCAGLISVGDAVCTTTPLAGRGVALALMQARELVQILDQRAALISATMQFDNWCTQNIRPWFDDHRYADADRMRRWSGEDVDLSRRLPSDLIVAAADADPELKDHVGPYVTMDALPASLAPADPRAREIYAAGGARHSGRPDSRRAQRGGVQDTGSRLMPWMNGDSRREGSSVASNVGHLAVQFLERHADLAAGQVGAEAEVCAAAAEAGVWIRCPADIESPRIGELVLIAVGRAVPQRRLVAGRHLHAAQLAVLGQRAPHVDHRRRPPHDLLDSRGCQRVVVGPPLRALVGKARERQHAVADRVAGGLVARHDQQDEERRDLGRRQAARHRPRPAPARWSGRRAG